MIEEVATAMTPAPESMQALMWWIIVTLCAVVTVGFSGGGRFVYLALAECRRDREALFTENRKDRREFRKECRELNKDKFSMGQKVAYLASECKVDMGNMVELPIEFTDDEEESV